MDTKQIRQALKLSQDKFAVLIGVAPYTVRRWEAGKANPSPLSLEKLKELEEK